jgi:SagB-type dehydrogenase family enzyme
MNSSIKNNRQAIKPRWIDLYETETKRKLNLPKPKQFKEMKEIIDLIPLDKDFSSLRQKSLAECIKNRRSLRSYSKNPLSFIELSYILWETSRVDYHTDNAVYRTIPTGGATNSMETYVYLNNVTDLKKGIYHYLQEKHCLALYKTDDSLDKEVDNAILKQLRGAAIVVFFTAVVERSEYKYDFCAHKMIAIEAGHAGQNLSLAAEIIDSGVCAICAYDQDLVDRVLEIDGFDEFTTYCFTLGKKKLEKE